MSKVSEETQYRRGGFGDFTGWERKSEIRIPKLETNTKSKGQRLETEPYFAVFGLSRFGPFSFVSDFGLRISDLGSWQWKVQFKYAAGVLAVFMPRANAGDLPLNWGGDGSSSHPGNLLFRLGAFPAAPGRFHYVGGG